MSIAKKVIDFEKLTLTIAFANGQTLSADINDFDENMWNKLTMHGLSQKLGDSYAGAESVDSAYATCSALLDQLKSGVWAAKSSRGGIVAEALARATGKPLEEAIAAIAKMEKPAIAALKKHPAWMKAKAEIEMERAKALSTDATEALSLDDL